mgnify:CR=1 FL=1
MISFVIPAHNESRLLGGTLQSVQDAARTVAEAFEVIVVDDASDDGTAQVAADNGAQVLHVEHRHIAATRNAGAAMAASSVSVVSNALLLKRWRPAGVDSPR